jgi:tetratricopeptide (TPR) repeat protein
VILFHLLTGELPFRGNLRMLLKQVVEDDAPSPRKLNGLVPRDLETICLKCLEKAPDRRYRTAADLAADLHRHLRREPILARPLAPPERAWRWCQRHPVLVRSVSAILATLIVALVLVTRSWQQERLARNETLDLLQREQAARQDAETNRRLALDRLREARDAVDTSLTAFASALRFYPGATPARKQLLLKAVQDYEHFVAQGSSDVDLELERGRTYYRLGDVHRELKDHNAASQAYRVAESVFRALVQQDVADVTPRVEAATAGLKLAVLQREQGQRAEANQTLSHAIRELEEALRADPSNPRARDTWATALANRALLLRDGGQHEDGVKLIRPAVTAFRELIHEAPDESRYRVGLAQVVSVMGELESQREATGEAVNCFEEAIATFGELLRREPDHLEYVQQRADVRVLLAGIWRRLGRDQDERQAYAQVIAEYESVRASHPSASQIEFLLAIARSDLGALLREQGDTAGAARELTEALTLLAPLAPDFATIPAYHEAGAAARSFLAEVYRDQGRTAEARTLCERAIDTYRQLADQVAEQPSYRERLAVTRALLGRVLLQLNDRPLAEEAFRAALTDLDDLMSLAPSAAAYRHEAAHVRWRWGEAFHRAGRQADADQQFRIAERLWNGLVADCPEPEYLHDVAWYLTSCADGSRRDPRKAIDLLQQSLRRAPQNAKYRGALGAAHYRAGQWDLAVTALTEALRQRPDGDGTMYLYLAMAYQKRGDKDQANAGLQRGTRWVQERCPGDPDLQQLRNEAMGVLGGQTPAPDPGANAAAAPPRSC